MPLKEENPRRSQRSSAGDLPLPNSINLFNSSKIIPRLNPCQRIFVTDSWDVIFSRIGEKVPRRGRARCPIHGGNSFQSLAVTEEKGGRFFCHVCHAKGDKISFIQQLYGYDFREALSFFGLANGKVPKPDPGEKRRAHIRYAKAVFRRYHTRRVRDILYNLNCALSGAEKRLAADAEDPKAWLCLSIYHRLYPRYERLHDLLISRYESEQTEAFREIMGRAA